jgi:class 3 adenylate cyclase
MERRLAAILAADVVGYSRLMAADEAGTLTRLNQFRTEIIEPKLSQFGGRVVGSSLLVEFTSAVNAVECAVQVQASLAEQNAQLLEDSRMAFRIGVNLGDVIVESGTIYGEGVNIAARLEKLAEPGGICISRNVHDQLRGKLSCAYVDLGEQRVHNIPQSIQAYRVQPDTTVAKAKPNPPLPDRPKVRCMHIKVWLTVVWRTSLRHFGSTRIHLGSIIGSSVTLNMPQRAMMTPSKRFVTRKHIRRVPRASSRPASPSLADWRRPEK